MKGLVLTSAVAVAAFAVAAPFETVIAPRTNETWRGAMLKESVRQPYAADAKAVNLASFDGAGAVMPLLVSSAGRYVWSERPFTYSFSNGWLRIVSPGAAVQPVEAGKTLKDAYLAAMRAHFPFNGKVPPDEFFTKPQFNNWIEMYVRGVNQATVDAYTEEIATNRFPCGVYMMDGGWMSHQGSLKFDHEAFPDPEGMFARIRAKGWKSLIWMAYFVSPDSREYKELRYHPATHGRNLLLHRAVGNEAAIIRWWSGCSAAWDLTNPMALGHFLDRLMTFADRYRIDGFKFDAGDAAALCGDVRFQKPGQEAVDYVGAYGKFARFFPYNEFRTSWKQGGRPMVMRLQDKKHTWADLRKVIPEVELAGLLGSPYCVADMIGGGDCGSYPPDGKYAIDERLFVRSCALQALMPMMQFSLAPWRVLSKENCAICRDYARLHLKFAPYILELAKQTAQTGEPIVRAMDYEFPGQGFDRRMQQFMLGPKYLVAPVVRADDAVTIEIPAGLWKDVRGMMVEGPKTLALEHVPLSYLPYFERQ